MIIRTNMHINDMQFMMTEKGVLKAVSPGAPKKDESDDDRFFFLLESSDDREVTIFQTGRYYLNYMEEKTFSLMKNDDVKLCLFVCMVSGWGSRILSQAVSGGGKARGYKNMFLWTGY